MSTKLDADLGTFQVGVDFGTSNTVAMLRWPDGRARPVLFDGAPLLPSAVFADPSGELFVGRDAVNAAMSYPEGFEPYPKRRIDEGVLLLGAAEVPVSEAIAAVLRRVVEETRRVAGRWPGEVVLTYPASWAARRRGVLLDAAARAGIAGPTLVPEPLAAAFHFAELLGARVPDGGHLLVYDFGAGTFDASVVRRTPEGFAVVASEGLGDTGGLDVDAALVAHLGAVYGGRDPGAWRRLESPAEPADRRRHRQLWDGVRAAKEALSRTGTALVHVPVLEQDAPIAREQLEQLARPVVDRSVTVARGALLDAGVDLPQLAGVILVGGASRMPIVATQLHRALGIAPTVLEQPELVVAEGSLRAAFSAASVGAAATVVMDRVRAAAPLPAVDAKPGRRRRVVLAVAGGTAAVVLAVTGVVVGKGLLSDGDRGGRLAGDGAGERSAAFVDAAGTGQAGTVSPGGTATGAAATGPSGTAGPTGAAGRPGRRPPPGPAARRRRRPWNRPSPRATGPTTRTWSPSPSGCV
ncbi:Hsp70 family protein [Phytohabitans rumicis]|uniref:Molecular chaperone DnaK n=1 Tax=Phytohabitans rumicis TaxID=1076125 RepID=A0A6V8LK36_9ACTN|nr:Hsp70 family protein [Phytohabitans rumicis]GFJ94989.1 hypothetical protein Prum_086310 [Phytohabitans rumicis]